jgi:hypothetical protein
LEQLEHHAVSEKHGAQRNAQHEGGVGSESEVDHGGISLQDAV